MFRRFVETFDLHVRGDSIWVLDDVDNAGRLQRFRFQVTLKMESACPSETPEKKNIILHDVTVQKNII